MGQQTSRIYIPGLNKDHKEIYLNGKYHNKMYIGSTLVWEKTEGIQLGQNGVWEFVFGSDVLNEYYAFGMTAVMYNPNTTGTAVEDAILYKGNVTNGFLSYLSLLQFDMGKRRYPYTVDTGYFDKESNTIFLGCDFSTIEEKSNGVNRGHYYFLIRKISLDSNTVEDYYIQLSSSIANVSSGYYADRGEAPQFLCKEGNILYYSFAMTDTGSTLESVIKFDIDSGKFTRYDTSLESGSSSTSTKFYFEVNGEQYNIVDSYPLKYGIGGKATVGARIYPETLYTYNENGEVTKETIVYYADAAVSVFDSCEDYVNALIDAGTSGCISGGNCYTLAVKMTQGTSYSEDYARGNYGSTENCIYYENTYGASNPLCGFDTVTSEVFETNEEYYSNSIRKSYYHNFEGKPISEYGFIATGDNNTNSKGRQYAYISKETIKYFFIGDYGSFAYPFYEKKTDAIYGFAGQGSTTRTLLKADLDNKTVIEVT